MEKNKKPFPYMLAIKGIVAVLILLSITTHIGYTITESVPFKIYLHYPYTKLQQGKYYAFKHDDYKYKGMAIKKLVCMPGQEVSRIENALFCDGEFMVNVEHTVDSYNNPLPVYTGEKLADKAFFIGDNPRSYDSRYFGGVPVELIKREVKPIKAEALILWNEKLNSFWIEILKTII